MLKIPQRSCEAILMNVFLYQQYFPDKFELLKKHILQLFHSQSFSIKPYRKIGGGTGSKFLFYDLA